jgi:predicted nucleotidyltransferase
MREQRMSSTIAKERETYSLGRLEEIKNRLSTLAEFKLDPDLTVFAAGSYARLEASKNSDIDMFFLSSVESGHQPLQRTNSLRMFGKIIDTVESMGFPKFSNDCEYLVILKADDIVSNLGSRTDDHENYFTARMLLLLESHCLFGEKAFQNVMERIVSSYFKDFPDHQQTFQPIFLLNDIGRYWKTMLLNYEHKRLTMSNGQESSDRKTKQKVRNFKLKFSRMTTCFASAAAFGSYLAPVTEKQIIEITKLTPRQRLESIKDRVSGVDVPIKKVLDMYDWFLEMTGLTTAELESHFSDKQKRTEMFKSANEYGDAMFGLLQAIDQTDPRLRLLRHLVI